MKLILNVFKDDSLLRRNQKHKKMLILNYIWEYLVKANDDYVMEITQMETIKN